MPRYRKKPIEIRAVRWTGEKFDPCTNADDIWLCEAIGKRTPETGAIIRHGRDIIIYTLEGNMTASPGDYIIQGVKGEICPCKPDVFEQTYEEVE